MLAKWSKLKNKIYKIHKFVIHKHHATRLHYDLRLEIGGVLVSFAMHKGPSANPNVKIPTVRVVDHALEYINFEGVIPPFHYGAGPVMVWDSGIFKNIRKKNGKLVSIKKCLEEGELKISFQGKKIKGAYSLLRVSPKKNWLLIKLKDKFASKKSILKNSRSVKTGRTMKQILES